MYRFPCYHVIVSQTAYWKRVHAVRSSQLLSAPFLAALETQIFVNNPRHWWSMDPPASCVCSVALRFVFVAQQQRLNCVDVFISMRSASAAARTPVDCSELHQQPVDAVLCPTFVQKLCYILPNVVTFADIKILSSLLNGVKVSAFAWFSVIIRVIFGVQFERRKVDKKANLWRRH